MTLFCIVLFWVAATGLTYVLLGYPLISLFASGLVQHKRFPPCEPTVSLIIPAHNEQLVVEAKIENSLRLDYPREKLDIVVASDGSEDDTEAIARSYEDRGVTLLAFSPRRGKASVLTDAAIHVTSEVLCFCDANVMFDPSALRTLTGRLGDESVGAVSGDVQIASHESDFGHGEQLYYRLERSLQLAESLIGSLIGVDGGMYLVRSELFQPLPPDTILDDFVTSMRVVRQGYRVVYEPDAVARENGTPTAAQEWRRRVRVAAGTVQSVMRGEWPPLNRPVELWQYVSHKALRWMTPLFMIVLLWTSVVLASSSVLYLIALVSQLLGYFVACLGWIFLRFRRTRFGGVPFYFVMSNIAMAVGLVKGLFRMQPVMWPHADRSLAGQAVEQKSS